MTTESGAVGPTLKAELLASIPRLRAFALSLCGRPDQADDLVQETLLKAWANLSSFQPSTNIIAWLYTILRNEFYTRLRKGRREVSDPEGSLAAQLVTYPAQADTLHLQDFQAALFTLPPDQREALMLVGALGMSYDEAATLCGCAIGTIKSRVNRARSRLETLLSVETGGDSFGPDKNWRAVASASVGTEAG